MPHVLEDHDERVAIHTNAIEADNVVVLQVGQQLRLPLKILPGPQGRLLQGLKANRAFVPLPVTYLLLRPVLPTECSGKILTFPVMGL